MLQVSEWLQQAVGHETTPHVPKQGQAMSSRSREQPVPQGETDRWAHHETMPQVSEGGWSQEGSHMQARDRWIGMPCRVRLNIYLVSYGGERGEGEKSRERREREKKRKRERETDRRGRGEVGGDRSCLLRGRQKRKGLMLESENQLASVDGSRVWAWLVC